MFTHDNHNYVRTQRMPTLIILEPSLPTLLHLSPHTPPSLPTLPHLPLPILLNLSSHFSISLTLLHLSHTPPPLSPHSSSLSSYSIPPPPHLHLLVLVEQAKQVYDGHKLFLEDQDWLGDLALDCAAEVEQSPHQPVPTFPQTRLTQLCI